VAGLWGLQSSVLALAFAMLGIMHHFGALVLGVTILGHLFRPLNANGTGQKLSSRQ